MAQLGYEVVACEGPLESIGYLPGILPGALGRHRPDVVGRAADGSLCIGEAKTASDALSRRTHEQLEDYLAPNPDGYHRVILGYPRSADQTVRSLLEDLGATDSPQLVLLPVPDELLDA
jgi:hypothetical protein